MSNLLKRVLVGIVGIPLIVFVSYIGGILFLVFSLIASSLALWEFYSLFEKKNYFPLKAAGVCISGVILIIHYFYTGNFIIFVYSILIFFFTMEIFRSEKRNPVNSFIIISGYLYITVPFIMLGDLLDYPNFNLIIYTFVLIWACDTAAYFGGKSFGKNYLSSISPKKTWEGSIIGFVFSILVSLGIHFIFPERIDLHDALVAGVIIGVFSQIGDLFESLLKRYCHTKDSSNIIPGHGGVLDRFDSLIFVTPLIFIYFRYIK